MNETDSIVLVGYSGHAYVVAEVLKLSGFKIIGYLEKEKVLDDLMALEYLGYEKEASVIDNIRGKKVFPAIGDNFIRNRIMDLFEAENFDIPVAIHPKAHISEWTKIGKGSVVCQGACINPFTTIGKGVIINTGAIIEHNCNIEDMVHIAPGAVLAGNVLVGSNSFVGANSVIKQGIRIGRNVVIGAGSVVLKDVEDNCTYAGNPAKQLPR